MDVVALEVNDDEEGDEWVGAGRRRARSRSARRGGGADQLVDEEGEVLGGACEDGKGEEDGKGVLESVARVPA